VALLDAKYRDLWERPLPPDMLYQLALYALTQPPVAARAVILYPTLQVAARDQAVMINEPSRGSRRAEVILRPVNLLTLDELLRSRGPKAERQKRVLAHLLAFAREPERTPRAAMSV
jgi:5-methylcytosine-specific restriction enzyme subunit McrC